MPNSNKILYKIVFAYVDEMSNGKWKEQECIVSSIAECKKIYGLDTDPTIYDYKIISVNEIFTFTKD